MSTLLFSLGAPVQCEDGTLGGKLTHVVVNADGYGVTDLIVTTGFPLISSEARVVPIRAVRAATEDGVCLSMASDALAACTAYQETFLEIEEASTNSEATFDETGGGYCTTPVSPPIRQHLHRERAERHLLLGDKTEVRTLFESVGSVAYLLVDQKRMEITHVVVSKGIIRVDHLLIPVELVGEISEEEILLVASHQELDELPRYAA
jgi:hypothetical protein